MRLVAQGVRKVSRSASFSLHESYLNSMSSSCIDWIDLIILESSAGKDNVKLEIGREKNEIGKLTAGHCPQGCLDSL